MGIKVLGFTLYWSAVSSLAYSMYSGSDSVAGFGVAVAWVTSILTMVLIIIALLVSAVGNEEQKSKIKDSMNPGGVVKVAFGALKSLLLFSLLCISGYWVTAIAYGLPAVLFMVACASTVKDKE